MTHAADLNNLVPMDMAAAVEAVSTPVNAAGQYYLAFPYTSSIGTEIEPLVVQVPMKHDQPSAGDKKALLEAVTVQGGIGQWVRKEDGAVWLIPAG